VLRFKAGTALIIEEEGTLIARGSASQKIVFTGEEKLPGFWRGILFFSSDVRNVMDHVEVSCGGGRAVNDIWLNEKANVALTASSLFFGKLTFTNSVSSQSGGTGLYVQEGAELNIFSGNTFSSNVTSPVIVPVQEVKKLDAATRYKGTNGKEVIQIIASTLNEPIEAVWSAPTDGTPYLITGNLRIESGLRIQEGAVLEFGSSTALIVGSTSNNGGYLIARGTATRKIIFTGENRTQPSWRGILFFSGDVRNEMDHTEVTYAGSSPVNDIWLNEKANVALTHSSLFSGKLKLTNSKISNGGGWGIVVQRSGSAGATLVQSGNTLSPNTFGTIKP
jgi:hypothetical protein